MLDLDLEQRTKWRDGLIDATAFEKVEAQSRDDGDDVSEKKFLLRNGCGVANRTMDLESEEPEVHDLQGT